MRLCELGIEKSQLSESFDRCLETCHVPLDFRHGQIFGANFGHDSLWAVALNHVKGDLGATDALFSEGYSCCFDVSAARIDIRRVAQT